MKIAIIGHKRMLSREGGIEKGVRQHAVRMAALGHQVVVYDRGGHNVYGEQYDKKPEKEYQGVKIIRVPATVFGHECVPLYSLLATLHAAFVRYDVVSYRASGPCVMIPLAKFFGLRCVASLHGIDSRRDKWGGFVKKYLEFGERMAAKRADVCLVLSQAMKGYIKEKYGTDALCFANGMEETYPTKPELIREKYGLDTGNFILSLGRIEPEKGLHYLIRAFRRIQTEKKLVIAGGGRGAYLAELKELAKGDPRIIFTGYITGRAVLELYSGAYLFVLPSNLEGMANTLLEAMAYGNCCLVSDIPENTEVVRDKAVTFSEGDERDLKEKLEMLLESPETVRQYREGASEYILERYNWDIAVEQMLRVYSGERVEYEDVYREHCSVPSGCTSGENDSI